MATKTRRTKVGKCKAELLREEAAWMAEGMLTLQPKEGGLLIGAGPGTYYSLFLQKLASDGEFFDGFTLAADNPVTKAWRRQRRPKPKHCWYNSFQFVLDHPDEAVYYEGRCNLLGNVFIDHAWVAYRGQVFDFTLEAAG